MNPKFILYLLSLLVIIPSLDGLNLNFLFKKNRFFEARIIYIMIALSFSYLVVNFIYDFFEVSKIF